MKTTVITTTPATGFTCVGTNPNWNLSISKNQITYSSVARPNVMLKAVTPLTPSGDNSGNLQVYATEGKNIDALFVIKRNSTSCTSGALSQNYSYDAVAILPGQVSSGCCNPS
jgi:uncharacterized membrane protein